MPSSARGDPCTGNGFSRPPSVSHAFALAFIYLGAAVEAPLARHASGGFETYLDKHPSDTVRPGLFLLVGTGAAAATADGTMAGDPASPRRGLGGRGTARRRACMHVGVLRVRGFPRRDFYPSAKEALRAVPSGAVRRPSCARKVHAAWRWRR